MTEVQKFGYPVQVRLVDGVPQCPCHQEPMVQRDGGWMCPVGAATADLLAAAATRLEGLFLDRMAVPARDRPDLPADFIDAHPWQEYNAHGNTCHYPGCRLTEEEHVTFLRPRP